MDKFIWGMNLSDFKGGGRYLTIKAEKWLSGLRRTLGKRVGEKSPRRFESCLLRFDWQAHPWKGCIRASVSGVRIPLSPPVENGAECAYFLGRRESNVPCGTLRGD